MSGPFNKDEPDQPRRSAGAQRTTDSAPEQLRDLLPDGPTIQITEDHVRSVLSARRGRESIFGWNLFSDPAWDVLLELYAAQFANRTASASELASVIGAPRSVIARWITTLVDAGLVAPAAERTENEPTVTLTDNGAAKMARLMHQWSSAFFAI